MIAADLYLNTIDFLKYLPGTDCQECGDYSCGEFLQKLKKGLTSPEKCPALELNQVRAFSLALEAEHILPQVPALDLPRPAPAGLLEINNPDELSSVVISGNSEFTQEIVTAIMACTTSPFWVLFVDCRGDTVDMAMIYHSLTVAGIRKSLPETLAEHLQGQLILPGFARSLAGELAGTTGCEVTVGPRCIVELPLFLGEQWQVAGDVH
ncbi:MAG: hypothetical protein JRJ12_07665 [Deltaproteobacteria bacterium]|nr:hypothetical protein [Deltaproteobacteria bacterium]MBW2070363.1 hypothetical protein [Deltaproteobacteria bacterium]